MKFQDEIDRLIADAKAELAELESHRLELLSRLAVLQKEKAEGYFSI